MPAKSPIVTYPKAHPSLVGALIALALSAGAGWARIGRPVVDEFTVNAQYRGAVKKGIRGVGTGIVDYQPLSGNTFQVRVKGEVQHPDTDRVYAFLVDQSFEVKGNQLELISESKKLNDAAKEQEEYIIQVVPFSYIARFLPPPGPGEEPVRTFFYQGAQFDLRYRRTHKQVEIDLYKDDWNVGKFFLARDWGLGQEAFEKFRIPFPHEKIMVSFVVKSTHEKRVPRPDPQIESKIQKIRERRAVRDPAP